MMNQAIVFVCPCGVGKDALNGEIDFGSGLLFTSSRR